MAPACHTSIAGASRRRPPLAEIVAGKPGNSVVHLVLVAGEARTDKMHFYLFQAGRLKQDLVSGDLVTRETSPVFLAAKFAFSMDAHSEVQLYVSVENPVDLAADFTLMREDALAEFGGRIYLLQGIFFGAITVLLLDTGAASKRFGEDWETLHSVLDEAAQWWDERGKPFHVALA